MLKRPLSRLQKVDLRDVWGHEAADFSVWLSQQENLDILSEEIGVDIKPLQTEARAGQFKVDILAEEGGSGRKIIIENQLEETNHDHLGKIITYASGFDAEIIVWVVSDVREEHQRAVEWLNEHTDENTSFFLIKIELWQIEGSNPAPKFEIISSPNEWAKAIKNNPSGSELTETKLDQLEFWKGFKDYAENQESRVRFGRTPRPQHWYSISIGSSEAHIALTLDSRKSGIACEIYISRNKHLFEYLKSRKSEIEKDIGQEAEWIDASVAARIVVRKMVPSVFGGEKEDNFRWLFEKTVLFNDVFGRYIKEFPRAGE